MFLWLKLDGSWKLALNFS